MPYFTLGALDAAAIITQSNRDIESDFERLHLAKKSDAETEGELNSG